MEKIDFTVTYRVFHPMATDCTFFSLANGTFYKLDHILDPKETVKTYKKLQLFPIS
jgi:hypothetical protein